MRKTVLLIATVWLSLAGCTNKENLEESGSSQNNEITISPFVGKMMKGAGDATTTELADGISVYAYKTGTTETPFMNNVIFKKNENNYWASTPTYYWPSYNLDFYGYYPISIKPTVVTAPTVFSYTANTDASAQEDIVVTSALNEGRVQSVQLKFHHALSKIGFIFSTAANSGLNINITNIKFVDISNKATFTLVTTAIAVPNYFTISDLGNDVVTNNFSSLASTIVLTAAETVKTSDLVEGMYVIPQELTNWAYGKDGVSSFPLTNTYLELTCTLSGVTDYEGKIAIPITTTKWDPGQFYIYTIAFGGAGATGGGGYNPDVPDKDKPQQILAPILLSVSVDNWENLDDLVEL